MQYGEIITLGCYRLMCGDARKREDIEKLCCGENVDLILTDLPYGMKVQNKNGRNGSDLSHIINNRHNPNKKAFKPRVYPHIERIRKYTQLWSGILMQGSYVLNARGKTARIHPTQKPVELHAHILEDFSKAGAIVLDAFGGSGTTLIACEVTERTCLMMEISPEYCEIIRERYEKLLASGYNINFSRSDEP